MPRGIKTVKSHNDELIAIIETGTPFSKLVNKDGFIALEEKMIKIEWENVLDYNLKDFDYDNIDSNKPLTSNKIKRIQNSSLRQDFYNCINNYESKKRTTGNIFQTDYIWFRHIGANTKHQERKWYGWRLRSVDFIGVNATLNTTNQFVKDGPIFNETWNLSKFENNDEDVTDTLESYGLNDNINRNVRSGSGTHSFANGSGSPIRSCNESF